MVSKAKKTLKGLVQEFSDNSSIHGINYIFGSISTNLFDRFVWLIVFLGFSVLVTIMMKYLYM